MKPKHRIPREAIEPRSATLPADYQAEVDRTMAKAEAAYRQAQKRVEYEERRLVRAEKMPATPKRKRLIAEITAVIELRRIELEKYHRMLTATGAPSTSRGTKSHRHVPRMGVL